MFAFFSLVAGGLSFRHRQERPDELETATGEVSGEAEEGCSWGQDGELDLSIG